MYAQTHNQFDGISKRRVHKTSDGLSKLDAELFGREAEQGCERYNGEEVDNKGGSRIDVQDSEHDSGWDEDQKDVDIVAAQDCP